MNNTPLIDKLQRDGDDKAVALWARVLEAKQAYDAAPSRQTEEPMRRALAEFKRWFIDEGAIVP